MRKGTNPSKSSLSPKLKQALREYEAGDVVAARGQARVVLLESPSPADATQAKDLIDRTETPRSAFYFALLAALAIGSMIILAVLRS